MYLIKLIREGYETLKIAKVKGLGDANIMAIALNQNSPVNYVYVISKNK